MRENKGKSQDPHNKFRKEESFEANQIDHGLESVAEGYDFAEGDQNSSPQSGGEA